MNKLETAAYNRRYREEHKDELAISQKKYREDHKQKVASYQAKYYKDNREVIIEQAKKNYEENKGAYTKYKKEYYQINKESISEKGKEYQRVNKDAIVVKKRAYHKKYYVANKQLLAKKSREYYASNKIPMVEKAKLYYISNKESIAEKRKVRYDANVERELEYGSEYRKNNRVKCNVLLQRYRSRKKRLPSTLTVKQWESIKEHFGERCAYCRMELPLEQEHLIPISKGGEYTIDNIICVCRSCNSSKGDREFKEWYVRHKNYSKERENFILKYLHYNKCYEQQLTLTI